VFQRKKSWEEKEKSRNTSDRDLKIHLMNDLQKPGNDKKYEKLNKEGFKVFIRELPADGKVHEITEAFANLGDIVGMEVYRNQRNLYEVKESNKKKS